MNHTEHREMQQRVINQVLAILKNDAHVLGVVMGGSYARGEHDAFSDLDVVCFLRDEERTGRPELYGRVGQIGPCLWQAWIYDRYALYLFENGVRLDLDFNRPSELALGYSGGVVAHDPDGILASALTHVPSPEAAPHPKWFEPGDQAMVDWFFWMFRQIVCWAKRGAQGDHRAFDKLSNAVNSLAELRTRLVEMRLWTIGVRDYLGRADPACARRLAQTYPHLQAEDIIQCATRLMTEYELVCPTYCQKAGATYPEHKVVVMHQLLAEFEQLV